MCGRGRYALQAQRRILRERLQAQQRNAEGQPNPQNDGAPQEQQRNNVNPADAPHEVEHVEADMYQNRTTENLSPGMRIPVITERNRHREVVTMTWGMIPAYEETTGKPNHFKLFNKRIETLQAKGYFRKLVETKRCVIVLDGFYEWQTLSKGVKQPNYVCYKDRPLLCAGIFELSRKLSQTGEVITFPTFSMITGEPSSKFSALHNREPALLSEEQAAAWLNSDSNVDSLLDLLVKCSQREESQTYGEIQYYPVTPRMNIGKYQEADCSLPLSKADFFSSAPVVSPKKEPVEVKKEPVEVKKEIIVIDLDADEPPVVKKAPEVASPVKSTGKRSLPSTPTESNKLTKYFQALPK